MPTEVTTVPDEPRDDEDAVEPQVPDRGRERDARTGRSAAQLRIQHQSRWVELQVQRAMERGEFDDLPGYGKPIPDLGEDHDPDWWVKKLVEREQLTVLPPALQVRKDDAELDGRLDRTGAEGEVRRELEEFNAAVRAARIQPLGGPPMITRERDVEAEVAAWRERRDARRAVQAEAVRRREQEAGRGRAGRIRRWLRWRGRRSARGRDLRHTDA